MTKLEELKSALEAATKGEWDYVVAESAEIPSSFVVDSEGEHILRHRYGVIRRARSDVEFIALAHNLMPTLLEAVSLLRANHKVLGQVLDSTCYELDEGQRGADDATKELLEKLL